MPPNAMILSIILGTPWQRKYKAVPDWETNSIKIKQEDGYVSQPFISPQAHKDVTRQTRHITNKGKDIIHNTKKTAASIPTTITKLVWRPKQTQQTITGSQIPKAVTYQSVLKAKVCLEETT